MKALVIGGNGFIGSHVVDYLLEQGCSVRVYDRSLEYYRDPLPHVDYRLAEFNDTPALAEALEGIDVVYHFVSTTVPSTSNKAPIFDVESNLIGTIKLLNLMRDSSVRQIIYLSSGGTVYGIPSQSPVPESHPLQPICSYGVVKVAIENYLYMYHHLYDIKFSVLRVSNPYGERQGHSGVQGVIGTFIGKVLNGESIDIWGDGSIVRDYIYVHDLAKLCVLVGLSETNGVFNVGSGRGKSINEVVDILSVVSGHKIVPKYHSKRAFDIPHVVLDITSIEEQFSWTPDVSLTLGIEKTWKWMESNLIT